MKTTLFIKVDVSSPNEPSADEIALALSTLGDISNVTHKVARRPKLSARADAFVWIVLAADPATQSLRLDSAESALSPELSRSLKHFGVADRYTGPLDLHVPFPEDEDVTNAGLQLLSGRNFNVAAGDEFQVHRTSELAQMKVRLRLTRDRATAIGVHFNVFPQAETTEE